MDSNGLTDDGQVKKKISAILNADGKAPAKKKQLAEAVSGLLRRRGKFYNHAELRNFDSAMYFDSVRRILMRLQSDEFKAWLSSWIGINRAEEYFKHVFSDIETAALTPGLSEPIVPEGYWTCRGDKIYFSNGDGQMARITATGVEMVDNGTDGVLFAAGRTVRPWRFTEPIDPFEACSVFHNAKYESEHGLDLISLFVIAMPQNPSAKPLLGLIGPIGSGKTTVARAICELYGIPINAVKVDERKESDFWPTLNNGGMVIFDNVDTRVRWLPDALASASTHGCSSQRRLYTNADTLTLKANAWIAITSANPSFGSDPGLADRMLVVRLGRRDGPTADRDLTQEIEAHRDAGLSFIVRVLSNALGQTGEISSGLNSRHPDFARFAVQIGRALGRQDQIIRAMRSAEADKGRFCLENSHVGSAILALVHKQTEVSGTAADLVSDLQRQNDDLHWLTAKKLSRELSRLWPHLQSLMEVGRKYVHGGAYEYTFRLRADADVTNVTTKSPEPT